MLFEMEGMPGDSGQSEPGPSNSTWWSSKFMEKLQSISLDPHERSSNNRESADSVGQKELLFSSASLVLWATGALLDPIPNLFYSIIPVSQNFMS